ncbi:MAG: type II toxin-antitoxin system HicA family toxin [Spirochaetaceae bacterium]
MPRIPRDCGSKQLIRLLASLGYRVVRRKGSHIRLYSNDAGHAITVPDHNPLRIGTLSNILVDVSEATGIPKENLIERLSR